MVALIDEATQGKDELAKELAATKLIALCNAGDVETAMPLGAKLLEEKKDDAGELNNIGWMLVDPDRVKKIDPKIAKLALQIAQRAAELTHQEDPSVLDTLSEAQFRSGDIDGAIATEEKVIDMSKGSDKVSNNDRQFFNEHLARYRKAAAEKAEGK